MNANSLGFNSLGVVGPMRRMLERRAFRGASEVPMRFNALMKEFISQPQRMGAPTQSRNTLGIDHPFAESHPAARMILSMVPGGGPVSGYTQEDIATLQLPEETPLFSPLGYDITDKDLAKVGLATDAMDFLPGAAIVGGMATGAGLLGRALKSKNYVPTSTEDVASVLLAPALQRQGLLGEAMVGGEAGAAALARVGNTAPQQAMELAEQMESAGRSRDEIWAATAELGYPVFRGKDGKLRFEIDDSAARTRGVDEPKVTRGALWKPEDAIEHPEFYDMNPDARLLQIMGYQGQGGRYIPSEGRIEIGASRSTSPLEFKSTGLHELQHATQGAEGFARGGTPEMFTVPRDAAAARVNFLNSELSRIAKELDVVRADYSGNMATRAKSIKALEADYDAVMSQKMDMWDASTKDPYDMYRALAGEAEARQVQARMDMTPAERAANPFYADFDVPEADQIVRYGDSPSAMVAYHGSPHKFGVLDPTKIGTGEGAQAFGHGLYVAENPDTAKMYIPDRSYVGRHMQGQPIETEFDAKWIAQTAVDEHGDNALEHLQNVLKQRSYSKNLAQKKSNEQVKDAINMVTKGEVKRSGHFYEIDVPDEDIAKMLDWDKPLSEQSEQVRVAIDNMRQKQTVARARLNEIEKDYVNIIVGGTDEQISAINKEAAALNKIVTARLDMDLSGADFYRGLSAERIKTSGGPGSRAGYPRGNEATSTALSEAGIPGIKYYDQGSRGAGEGTRNMVLFDDLAKRAKVLKRNDEAIAQPSVDLRKRDNMWELSKIETPLELRGKGLADAELTKILEEADAAGVPIGLTPSTAFGANKNKLTKWYKRHGFVPNKGRNKNFLTRESMIRHPRKINDKPIGGLLGAGN